MNETNQINLRNRIITYLQERASASAFGTDDEQLIIRSLHEPNNINILAGVELASTDLYNFDFSGLNLTDANFANANLSGANLSGANLTGADFSGANLTGADLTGANLTGADFEDAVGLTDDTVRLMQGGLKKKYRRKTHRRKTHRRK